MKKMISINLLLLILLTTCYVMANDEWNQYLTVLRTGSVSDRARIASVPSSPPLTQEQLKALRYHKQLLLKDIKKVRKEIIKRQDSTALLQEENAYEMKLDKINRYLKGK
jgi:hypothetical protein